MKALLYSDWCTLKGMSKAYPIPVIMIVAVAVMAGTSDGSSADPAALVSAISATAISCSLMMLASYGFIALFGADEREGWEAVRLSLPVTRTRIVRARYLILLLWTLLLMVVTNTLTMLIGAAITGVMYGMPALPAPHEVATLDFAILAAFVLYLSIEIPICFKVGLTKGRVYFTLPFLLCMLFTLEPVQQAATNALAGVTQLVASMGTPIPLIIAASVLDAIAYGVSMLVSQRIYARRDF